MNFPNTGFQQMPVQGMPGHQVSMMPGQQQTPGSLMMTPTQTQAASLQTQNSGMFSPGPTQQQFQQQPQQRPNMGVPPKGSDLDSLFADLDPLGTGMSKPFVDKKDFFTASKKAPRLTGASDDSLNNAFFH